jgi:AcrR family transcriptional regulator
VRDVGEAAVTEIEGVKRPRGRPRRVDRDRIIAVAKELDPSTLTMQALAEEIGVDRKTLHYHVDNRASLLRMVAADAFRDSVTSHDFVVHRDWHKALEAFAVITRDAVVAAGAWASYVRFETEDDLEAVRPAEAATTALVEAGLREADAGDVVRLVAELAFASARNPGPRDGAGAHPQNPVLEHALEQAPEGQFALTRRLLGGRSAARTVEEQFTFDLHLVTLGIERLIETSSNA